MTEHALMAILRQEVAQGLQDLDDEPKFPIEVYLPEAEAAVRITLKVLAAHRVIPSSLHDVLRGKSAA